MLHINELEADMTSKTIKFWTYHPVLLSHTDRVISLEEDGSPEGSNVQRSVSSETPAAGESAHAVLFREIELWRVILITEPTQNVHFFLFESVW